MSVLGRDAAHRWAQQATKAELQQARQVAGLLDCTQVGTVLLRQEGAWKQGQYGGAGTPQGTQGAQGQHSVVTAQGCYRRGTTHRL